MFPSFGSPISVLEITFPTIVPRYLISTYVAQRLLLSHVVCKTPEYVAQPEPQLSDDVLDAAILGDEGDEEDIAFVPHIVVQTDPYMVEGEDDVCIDAKVEDAKVEDAKVEDARVEGAHMMHRRVLSGPGAYAAASEAALRSRDDIDAETDTWIRERDDVADAAPSGAAWRSRDDSETDATTGNHDGDA